MDSWDDYRVYDDRDDTWEKPNAEPTWKAKFVFACFIALNICLLPLWFMALPYLLGLAAIYIVIKLALR